MQEKTETGVKVELSNGTVAHFEHPWHSGRVVLTRKEQEPREWGTCELTASPYKSSPGNVLIIYENQYAPPEKSTYDDEFDVVDAMEYHREMLGVLARATLAVMEEVEEFEAVLKAGRELASASRWLG